MTENMLGMLAELKALEWSSFQRGMGSGPHGSGGDGTKVSSCPRCRGINPSDRHRREFTSDAHGHRSGCSLEAAIKNQSGDMFALDRTYWTKEPPEPRWHLMKTCNATLAASQRGDSVAITMAGSGEIVLCAGNAADRKVLMSAILNVTGLSVTFPKDPRGGDTELAMLKGSVCNEVNTALLQACKFLMEQCASRDAGGGPDEGQYLHAHAAIDKADGAAYDEEAEIERARRFLWTCGYHVS